MSTASTNGTTNPANLLPLLQALAGQRIDFGGYQVSISPPADEPTVGPLPLRSGWPTKRQSEAFQRLTKLVQRLLVVLDEADDIVETLKETGDATWAESSEHVAWEELLGLQDDLNGFTWSLGHLRAFLQGVVPPEYRGAGAVRVVENPVENLLFHLALSEQTARQIIDELSEEDDPSLNLSDYQGAAWQLSWLSALFHPTVTSDVVDSLKARCGALGIKYPVS